MLLVGNGMFFPTTVIDLHMVLFNYRCVHALHVHMAMNALAFVQTVSVLSRKQKSDSDWKSNRNEENL